MSFGVDTVSAMSLSQSTEDALWYGLANLRQSKGAIYVQSAGNGFENYSESTGRQAMCAPANERGLSCQKHGHGSYLRASCDHRRCCLGCLGCGGKLLDDAGSANWISAPGGEFGENVSYAGLAEASDNDGR